MDTLYKRTVLDIQNCLDTSARAKKKIMEAIPEFGWRAAQEMHLLYLMGRTDMANENLKEVTRSLQGQKKEKTAATNHMD
jgi:hypothetical protein